METEKVETKKNNSFVEKNWSWMLAVGITFLTLLIFMITAGVTPFGNKTLMVYDCLQQYLPFFSELKYKLMNGESLFYSWNIGCGSDFLLLFVYYLSSPFNLVVLMFDKSDLYAVMSFLIIVKMTIAAGSMGFYLTRRSEETENNILVTAFAVAYALCGYMCGYYMNIMWLDSIMVFPVIILGLNMLVKDNKPFVYIIALFYSMFCNFYFSFMICIFLVLWFFTYHFENPKDFVKKGIRFALCSILPAGMAALSLMVAFSGLVSGNESAASDSFGLWYGNFAHILQSQYYLTVPVVVSAFDGDATLYCGVVTLVLMMVYPFIKTISLKDRIVRVCVLLFMLISMNQPVLNFLWHGFHDQVGIPNRFVILYVFVVIEMAYTAAINIKECGYKRFIPSFVICFFLPIISYAFNDFRGFLNSKTMLILAIAMSFVYICVVFVRTINEKTYKITTYVVAVMLLLEVISGAYISLRYNELNDISMIKPFMDERSKTVEYVRKNSDQKQFFREEILSWCINDETCYHNIHGVGTYVSTTGKAYIDNMGYLGFDYGLNYFLYSTSKPMSPFIDDMFGIRYVHAFDKSRDEEGYETIHTEPSGALCYENKDALPVGYGISRNILTDYQVVDFDTSYNQNMFSIIATGEEGPYDVLSPKYEISSDFCSIDFDEEYSYINCYNITQTYDNGLYDVNVIYNVDEDGRYYVEIPSYLVYNTVIYVNDELYDSGELFYKQMYLGDLKKGDVVSMIFQLPSTAGDTASFPVFMARYHHDREQNVVNKLAEHPFNVTSFDSRSMKGDVSLADGQILFMTIPYSEGWNITVDGKKTEAVKVLDSFIGLDIGPGEHTVEMKYTPKGFWPGLLISIISWIIFVLVVVFRKKLFRDSVVSESESEFENNSDAGDDTEIEKISDKKEE